MAEDGSKDFFISYNQADSGWAEWIAWQLEAEGYTTILQAWDFRPGGNFIVQMNEATKNAKRTVAVLSPTYLTSLFTQPEWAAAFAQDPTGQQGKLLPVRVRDCELKGLLNQIIYIDLVGLDMQAARKALSAGVRQSRALPSIEPLFPQNIPTTPPPTPSFPGDWPVTWNVPYDRNPVFTGREQLLTTLHEGLFSTKSVALTQKRAISGLGGIGKTQTALEYAYRYGQEYQHVMWVSAATRETFLTELGQLAVLLQLPEREVREQSVVVQAVIRWLIEHQHWLLILDNADDIAMVKPYLPTGYKIAGHLLLTTRTKYAGTIAQSVEVETMGQEEAITLLLRRAGRLTLDALIEQATPNDRRDAQAIVDVLGGLPLAIDQAGAYIEEARCSLSRYLSLYQTHRKELLQQRSTLPSDHPEPVATTWKLSFERVEQANLAAADLLRICAFLDPDTIPEDIFLKGASELGPVLRPVAADLFQLNAACKELLTNCLIRRNADDEIISVHRLVQAVLKDMMDEPTQRQWAELAVRTINEVFPTERWLPIQILLPHALVCARLIDDYQFSFPEASRLLDRAASYLQDAARYQEAELLFLRSLVIKEKVQGPEHPSTSVTLHNLALLYQDQGRYQEAEPLFLRSLAINEKVLGPEHSGTSATLNQLAGLYYYQGRYQEAEPLYLHALAIKEKVQGPEHPDTSVTLHNLAVLYRDQERYQEAEPLFLRSLAIDEKVLGSEHPYTAIALENYADLLQKMNRQDEAAPLRVRAQAIRAKRQS
jgi:tetratricopeptide (TPR) repeat protein